jgi:hypothetical protein
VAFVSNNVDCIIFDSVSSITIYQDNKLIIKFISEVLAAIKSTNTESLFYIMDTDSQKILIQDLGAYFDKIIDLNLI